MSRAEPDHKGGAQSEGSRWQSLYKIGAVGILLSLVNIPLSVVGFIIWPAFPPDILTIIQENWSAGLMHLDFPYLLGNVFGFPLFLIFFVTLRKVEASFLLSSFLMLRSDTFSRATAYVGIATNIVVFGLYVPVVGVYISTLSAVGYLVWFIQLGRRLVQLGWGNQGDLVR
jgi:hypothetical protein